jgi:hypothetical protein
VLPFQLFQLYVRIEPYGLTNGSGQDSDRHEAGQFYL